MATNKVIPSPSPSPSNFDAVLEAARKSLGWETMKDRGSDRLDFHDVSVYRMRKLLQMAYESGLNDMREGR